MTTGADHYREAERILAAEVKPANDPNRVVVLDLSAVAVAQVHAVLALAAAVALLSTFGSVGDSAEITDWARLIQPATQPVVEADVYPADWPPRPGDIWQDNRGRRWACQHPASFGSWDGAGAAKHYLVCLAEPGDDHADEIHRCHGPLTLVYRPEPREEAPF